MRSQHNVNQTLRFEKAREREGKGEGNGVWHAKFPCARIQFENSMGRFIVSNFSYNMSIQKHILQHPLTKPPTQLPKRSQSDTRNERRLTYRNVFFVCDSMSGCIMQQIQLLISKQDTWHFPSALIKINRKYWNAPRFESVASSTTTIMLMLLTTTTLNEPNRGKNRLRYGECLCRLMPYIFQLFRVCLHISLCLFSVSLFISPKVPHAKYHCSLLYSTIAH